MLPFALVAGIPAAVQGAIGLAQTIKGMNMKPERPNYKIPTEVGEAESITRANAYGGLPGQNILRQDINNNFAATVDAITRSGGDVNAAGASAGRTMASSNRNLALDRARYEQMAKNHLAAQLGLTAGYKDQEFELNKMQPYRDQIADKSRLLEGGMKNIMGGINSGVNAGLYGMLAKMDAPQTPLPGDNSGYADYSALEGWRVGDAPTNTGLDTWKIGDPATPPQDPANYNVMEAFKNAQSVMESRVGGLFSGGPAMGTPVSPSMPRSSPVIDVNKWSHHFKMAPELKAITNILNQHKGFGSHDYGLTATSSMSY